MMNVIYEKSKRMIRIKTKAVVLKTLFGLIPASSSYLDLILTIELCRFSHTF